MIKNIEFINFRNLKGIYHYKKKLNIVFGKNNSGKTNILDGVKLAFSLFTEDYFKINKSDFKNSDDSLLITIKVELDYNSIPTLNISLTDKEKQCGFIVYIKKTASGRYSKDIRLLNGANFDVNILREDNNIPSIYSIPLIRIEDIYTNDLSSGLINFINSEEKYKNLKDESKKAIKHEMSSKIDEFKSFCNKFNQKLDIEVSEPKISDEKVYIVDGNGDYEHNYKIGSGYKSIANIILNTLSDKNKIILIDEIENHLHPSLIRTLIKELRRIPNVFIIATTHSSVVINESDIDELIDATGINMFNLSDEVQKKLQIFLHPGRNEIMLADNVVLVEGYTEEMILKHYFNKINKNVTIINVAGVMFEPYIELASLLNKKVIVVSDNDKTLSDDLIISNRFKKLKELCGKKLYHIIEVENTLESDLYFNNYLDDASDLIQEHSKHKTFMIAKKHKKTEIAQRLIEADINLSRWHVIKEIEEEFLDVSSD